MTFLIYLVLLLLPSLTLTTQAIAAVGDAAYITDVLNVPLRSGPSTAHRIIHRGLPSGTQLTVLAINEEAEFTQVRTNGETEGWIRTQYLIGEPTARMKLATAKKRLKNLQAKIEKERQARKSIQSQHKEVETTNKTLTSRGDTLAKELAELKRISGDAINLHNQNVALTQQNKLLSEEVGELSATEARLTENVQRDWLMIGGGLVFLGLLLGVMLKSRPQRSSYSKYS